MIDKFFAEKTDEPRMFYLWGHSYEFDADNNWRVLENFGKIMGNRDDVWYATNIEIYDYITAFNRLEYTCDCKRIYNPSAVDVYLGQGKKVICVPAGEEISDF